MRFILKMAWRDSRTARRRLLLFSLSIVLGIAALVAIGSFSDNLRVAIDGQARGLLGADLLIGTRQRPPDDAQAQIEQRGVDHAREIVFPSMVVFPGSGGQTRLISLRATAGAYPFYGDVLAEPMEALAELRSGTADVALVDEALLVQYGAKVGDEIRLGRSTFRVAGVLKKMPGESAAVAMLSPRIYIPLARLDATGLLGPGSIVRYRTYLKLRPEEDAEALGRELRDRFRSLRLSFDTVEERKRELGQSLRNVYSFLSLVGFVALFLGAIGVASAIHVHVRQKIPTVAVLRCLGASARQSFAVYLTQGVALGLAGALLGAAIGIGVQLLLPMLVRDVLPFDVDLFVSWPAVARGMGAGLVICVLFTLLPLLAVRRVPPLAALRAEVASDRKGFDVLKAGVYALIVIAVVGFALWQTGRWQVGLGFAGMLALSFGLLAGLARVIAWAARRFLPRRLPYVWRQGVANLYRPNNRTVLLLLSLGLGTFLLLTLALARETLLKQLASTGGSDRPNLMFFDIQDDQIADVKRTLGAENAPVLGDAPVVTMRIRTLKGRAVEEILRDQDDRIPNWTLRREYRSTFRGNLSATEKLISGRFDADVVPNAEIIPISVEEGLARDMQLTLGDEIEWDVQGVVMRTRVTSLRAVEWQRLQPNFFVVFPRGVLEPAPKFYLVAVRVDGPEHAARVQQAIVKRFPNVSAIDLEVILQALDTIFSKAEVIVRFMALFTIGTGVIVLAGAMLAGRLQRVRETVLLRTLGASRRQLIEVQLVEYAVLGVLAAATGAALAVASNALLARFVFETSPAVSLKSIGVAIAGVATLTLVVGLFLNRGVARHPPLEVLRQET